MRSADPAPDQASRQQEDLLLLICFELCGQEFALPIKAVKETIAPRPLTPVPLCPPSVAGLINLRGDVVAVLDPAILLALPPAPPAPARERRVILLRGAAGALGHRPLCGLLVDRLTAAQRLPAEALRPPPGSLGERAAAYLAGVARAQRDGEGPGAPRLLLLLDPERLVGAEELRPFRRQPRAGDASPERN